jgi:integration host factor subunit beta
LAPQALASEERAMTKADLVEEICKRSRLSKSENSRIVDEILNAVAQALSEGHHIEIRGFGTFKVRARRSRRARNPRTGAEVAVPAKLVPVFKPSNQLKAMVRGDLAPPDRWQDDIPMNSRPESEGDRSRSS